MIRRDETASTSV